MQGRILKATGGFYYVLSDAVLYECRARGLFRKNGVSPLVGDWVEIEETGEEKGYVTRILDRKNSLIRPPLANLDQLFLVVSVADPQPNLLVLDKLIAIAEHKKIEPFLIVTKTDLGEWETLAALYEKAGFQVFCTGLDQDSDLAMLRRSMEGKISAFCGNSGVGKSSLLNRIDSRLDLSTAQISQKLGRGRHTTRHVQLYPVSGGGYIADTPGFSSMDLERYEVILKEQLQYCFREFGPHLNQCRFTGCSHTKEKGCAVLAAMKEGEIASSRHDSYCTLYEAAKNIKEWELQKK
ncbi:MAG: ribosome small subunit-dependent GTPase A [Oscillospiraceae bacterium]|nr:ribosome small subunit-dependent GTPase A [Oscillospiraceae bacterium]MDD7042284.1 ribosome small subunit-dependent GTPase A [Oscillospiraceae bacterium]MDY2610273.1 ribosome small subunit-dependent GTPase A [Oscillospiraceae bacterium]